MNKNTLLTWTAIAMALGSIAAIATVAAFDDVKWGPAPPGLPPGGELAVLAGDPGANGLVTVRLKMPAGYVIPPHTHPSDEHVTVLSGSLTLGTGEKMDLANAQTLTPGGYVVAPANVPHFATTRDGAIVQIHLMGPFGIHYGNPADDPRGKSAHPQ